MRIRIGATRLYVDREKGHAAAVKLLLKGKTRRFLNVRDTSHRSAFEQAILFRSFIFSFLRTHICSKCGVHLQTLLEVNHPNIECLFGPQYLVFELAEKGSLNKILIYCHK